MKKLLLVAGFAYLFTGCHLNEKSPHVVIDTVLTFRDEQAVKELNEYKQRDKRLEEERKKKLDEQKHFRTKWYDYIKLTSMQADVNKSFGGISNIVYRIKNSADYVIEKINLKVIYYKASGGIYKEEILTINNLQPGEEREVHAPDSNRGVKYQQYFQKIKCRAASFCYDRAKAGSGTNKIPDLFYCP